jgi:hypothetical protein
MQTNRSIEPRTLWPPHPASRASPDVVGRRTHAELGGRPPWSPPPTTEPSPLFTRHTLGVFEAERDNRRQRRARGATAYRAGEPHGRIAAAVAGNAGTVAQARLDMDRWVDEGGMVPFEAAALLRPTTSRR